MPPIGKCPTFSYHGSKCNIAKWIIGQIPKDIEYQYFIDLFGGRGNITFRLLTTPSFKIKNYILNDKFTGSWLNTLKSYSGNFDFVPDIVNYEVYDFWKNQPNSIERILIEPIVCYHGNRFNIQGSAINDPNNTTQYFSPNYKKNWIRKLKLAQTLLIDNNVTIYSEDWLDICNKFINIPKSFIYCDPPYYEKYDEKKTYPSIDHHKFLNTIKNMNNMICVSNYDNLLYSNELINWNKEKTERISLAKGRQMGHSNKRTEKTECLWKNF